jgi:hypothetical protein
MAGAAATSSLPVKRLKRGDEALSVLDPAVRPDRPRVSTTARACRWGHRA